MLYFLDAAAKEAQYFSSFFLSTFAALSLSALVQQSQLPSLPRSIVCQSSLLSVADEDEAAEFSGHCSPSVES